MALYAYATSTANPFSLTSLNSVTIFIAVPMTSSQCPKHGLSHTSPTTLSTYRDTNSLGTIGGEGEEGLACTCATASVRGSLPLPLRNIALSLSIFSSASPVKSRPFLFIIIYRSPKLGHLTAFQADFERLHPSFSTAVIVGDFNIDLDRSSHDTESY